MKARSIEEDVMLLMVQLQKLARFIGTLCIQVLVIVLRLLLGSEMDCRGRRHIS